MLRLKQHAPGELRTHLAAFEVYVRKGRPLLAAAAAKRAAAAAGAGDGDAHRCIVRLALAGAGRCARARARVPLGGASPGEGGLAAHGGRVGARPRPHAPM